jgi:hypothetical protein
MTDAREGGRIIGVEFLGGLIAQSGYNGESPLGQKRGFCPDGAEAWHFLLRSLIIIGHNDAMEVEQ